MAGREREWRAEVAAEMELVRAGMRGADAAHLSAAIDAVRKSGDLPRNPEAAAVLERLAERDREHVREYIREGQQGTLPDQEARLISRAADFTTLAAYLRGEG